MIDNDTPPSRLSTEANIHYNGTTFTAQEWRESLNSRNLYNEYNEYTVSGNLSLRNKSKTADSIATLLATIPQWQGINPENSLISRAFPNQSPLAEIGTIMWGKQMFFNSSAHLAQQYLPVINLGDALKGKNPFTKNVNMTITDKKNEGILDTVGDIVSKSFFNTNAIGNAYPFKSDSLNTDYIRNTGKGQLKRFFQAINLNVFKQVGPDDSSDTLVTYGNKVKEPIQSRHTVTSNKVYFNFNDRNSYPYWRYSFSKNSVRSIANASIAMRKSYDNITESNTIQMYAPTNQFIIDNFGTTNTAKDKGIENWVGDKSDNPADDAAVKLIWGRDGVSSLANQVIANLRGEIFEGDQNIKIDDVSGFKIKTGLLEYTRNLLNATEGNFVDITRKAFKDGDKVVGFNGSPLWRANNSAYSRENRVAGQTGVRQHSSLDQYDRFAKAIRFNGNRVYGGSPNSVIHRTVMPRIHPAYDTVNDKQVLDNKNMMFSIENLALNVIKRDSYAVIDDEWGTAIPLSEAGPFNGRIMWFPPYGLEFNETAEAKYESTVMVGRNEPMYNYQNSERGAQLSFILIVDYPEQLRNLNLIGENKNKAIADFFAFGGDPLPTEQTIEEYKLRIEKLKDKIPEESGPVTNAEPPELKIEDVTIYFPNDMPTDGEVDTIIDKMYNNPLHYEIIEGCESAQDGNSWGLNSKIFYQTGLTPTTGQWQWLLIGNYSQYTSGDVNDQFGICQLNKNLIDAFSNAENRKYYSIVIDGGSSKLYLNEDEATYNKKLGNRRIQAAKKLVTERLKAIFKDKITDAEIKNMIVTVDSAGSTGSSAEGALPENMSLKNVKEERRATIVIKRNNVKVEDKTQTLNQKQKDNIAEIQKEISALETKVVDLKNKISDNILNERNRAILKGYDSASGNFYYPAFHSQTPEEFHRRLTFLQQCTRQGSAKRYDIIDAIGNLRARNSVFGRQPICILRVGDFFYTKVVINNVTIDYNDTTWDMNPEGFGMQPMIAKVSLQMKFIGGQSLRGPIDALQNAASFNYYANSTFTSGGMYARPWKVGENQNSYINGILTESGNKLTAAYEALQKKNKE